MSEANKNLWAGDVRGAVPRWTAVCCAGGSIRCPPWCPRSALYSTPPPSGPDPAGLFRCSAERGGGGLRKKETRVKEKRRKGGEIMQKQAFTDSSPGFNRYTVHGMRAGLKSAEGYALWFNLLREMSHSAQRWKKQVIVIYAAGRSTNSRGCLCFCVTNTSDLHQPAHTHTVHPAQVWSSAFVKWLQIGLADHQLTKHLSLSNSASSQAHWLSLEDPKLILAAALLWKCISLFLGSQRNKLANGGSMSRFTKGIQGSEERRKKGFVVS